MEKLGNNNKEKMYLNKNFEFLTFLNNIYVVFNKNFLVFVNFLIIKLFC
jgi:hypothetical protein